MIIMDLSAHESDFCQRSTIRTGALLVRSLDVDSEYAIFAYLYDEYYVLNISRYDKEPVPINFWNRLQRIGCLYPDIDLTAQAQVELNNDGTKLTARLRHANYIDWSD